MITTNNPRKRSLIILRMHLPTYRTKYILRVLQLHTHVIGGGSNSIPNYSNSFHRICTTVRANIILRCNRNHKPPISNSLCRKRSCTMSMGRLCSRQRNTHTILCITLSNTIRNRSNSTNPPTIPTPNRIKQPPRTKQKYRQNPIPPVFHSKGHLWIHNHHHNTNNTNPKRTIYPKRPRQLYPRQPASNTSTHPTRMVLPIRICNSTINPKQARRSNRTSNINCNPIHPTNKQIKIPRDPILPN